MLNLLRRLVAQAIPARVATASCSVAVLLTSGATWAAGLTN